MKVLEVRWQGHPQVLVDGQVVKLPTTKCLLLLVYLGLEGQALRKHLATLFWSEQEAGGALRNLRAELHRLSQTPVGPYLQVSRAEVAPAGDWQVQPVGATGEGALQGIELPEGLLAEWLDAVRERQDVQAVHTLHAQVRELEQAGDLRGAREAAREVTRRNPLDEAAWLAVVRLSSLLGEDSQAQAAFAACQQHFQGELGLEPGAAFQAWLKGTRDTRDAADTDTSGGVVSLPLLGREELWRQLARARGPVLLLGEPGQGKTRLVTEFSAQRRPRLILRGLPGGQHWPLGTVSVLLRDLRERGVLDTLEPSWRSVALRFIPHVESTDEAPVASTAEAAALQGQLFDQLGLALASVLGAGTLVLEDLHDFDALSLHALNFVLGRLHRGAQVILTARPLELELNTAALAFVQRLRTRQLHTLTVNPWGETDVLLAVRTLARTSTGTRFAARLHGVTSGNPLFLLETWRHLQERGEVWEDERGWHTHLDDTTEDYAELSIPSSVQDTISARLALLPEEARRVLEALCVAGRPLSMEVLEHITGLTPWAMSASVIPLEQAGFVRTGHVLHVAHDLYRRATLAGLSALRRAVIHRELARVLTEQHFPALDIAEHYLAAERPQQAAEWLLRAAREANSVYAYGEMTRLLERALNLNPSRTVQTDAHLLLGRTHLALAHNEQARAHLDALRRLTQTGELEGVRQETDLLELQFLYNSSDYPQVVTYGEHLLTRDLPEGARGNVHQLLADTLIRMARLNEAETHLQQAEKLALNTPDHALRQARAWSARVRLHLFRREFPQAETLAAQIMDQAQRLNHPILLNVAYISLSAGLLSQGKFQQAEAVCRQGLAFAQQVGHHSLNAVMSLNLGNALIQLRQYAQAEQIIESALDLPDLSADNRAMLRRNLGTLKLWLGDLGSGLDITREALQQAQAIGAKQAVMVRRLGILRLHAEIGHCFALADWQELQQELTALNFGEAQHHLTCTRLWRALTCPDAERHHTAQMLKDLPFEADEAEAHHLLLAEMALLEDDLETANTHLNAAPDGPWRTELHLKVRQAQAELSQADLHNARQTVNDPQWQALHTAKLARTIARITKEKADQQEAQRRAQVLVDSLTGHPEQSSLQQLLA